MDHGSSDRVPASLLILLASVVFTLLTFTVFNFLWQVPISIYLVITVVGLQVASLLLGSSKVLTPLGAASMSTLIGIAAAIGCVFFLFPPSPELRIAGTAGSVLALVFVMGSFVAASRTDPVSLSAPEPLIFDDADNGHPAELIKYGEVNGSESQGIYDLPLMDESWEEYMEEQQVTVGGDDNISVSEGSAEYEPSGESAISNGWVDETARVMAYDTPVVPPDDQKNDKTENNKESDKKWSSGGVPGLNLRTRYKVLDSSSGEHYGTYYGDEGYSTLDPVSLAGLIGSRLSPGPLRIVKLDWSNFDEIEVHVQVEEVLPAGLEDDVEKPFDEPETFKGLNEDGMDALSRVVPHVEKSEEEISSALNPPGVHYTIYDRRTMQPMGDYVPEGDRSRIDRLMLYKMFPEYDFKTFEIDSIRWEADEVRIFIRGERKDSSKSKAQSSKERPGQRESLDGKE
jgi:hypothetical protein